MSWERIISLGASQSELHSILVFSMLPCTGGSTGHLPTPAQSHAHGRLRLWLRRGLDLSASAGGRGNLVSDDGWNTVPISKGNRPIDTSRITKITKVRLWAGGRGLVWRLQPLQVVLWLELSFLSVPVGETTSKIP